MKKILYASFAIAALAFGSSCSDDIWTGPGIDALPDVSIDDVKDEYALTTPHTSIVLSEQSIKNMKAIIAKADATSPSYDAYLEMVNDSHANKNYVLDYVPTYISRDDDTDFGGKTSGHFGNDFDAAYMQAIRWAATGDEGYAKKSREILVAYANTVTAVPDSSQGASNAPLAIGGAYEIASAIDLISTWEGVSDADVQAVKDMLMNHFVPVMKKFFETDPYTNGNWGWCVLRAYIAVAVLCDDSDMYVDAIYQSLHRIDNGTFKYYFDPVTGQCQETGRDQGHVQFGLSCAAIFCEIARNQGHDMYAQRDNAMMTCFEYHARLMLSFCHGKTDYFNNAKDYYVWQDVTTAKKYSKWKYPNDGETPEEGRNNYFRPCWATVYNHYVNRKGESMPYTKEWLDAEEWGRSTKDKGFTPYYFYDTHWFETFQFWDAI